MRLVILALVLALAAICLPAQAELIWWDGTRDPDNSPPGKLLSDNEGYWGDCVLTGVDYTYESHAQSPADRFRDTEKFGRRLLDGWVEGTWQCPVGEAAGTPLVVAFDFKRPCTFSEVDTVCSRTHKTSLKIEVRGSLQDPWRVVFDQSLDKSPNTSLNRAGLPTKPKGRYLRLSVGSEANTYADEVFVWGDAPASAKFPEAVNPGVKLAPMADGTFASIPGMPKTYFTLSRFRAWQASLGLDAPTKAVWSNLPTTPGSSDITGPILPAASQLCSRVSVTMASNEIERVALALSNTSASRNASLDVTWSKVKRVGWLAPARGVDIKLMVGGAIASDREPNSVRILPFLEEGNMPGRGLMKQYLTNGSQICDFPKVTLPPGGSAVMWLSVETKDAAPGMYEAEIGYLGGKPVKVSIEVLDVKLPMPDVRVTSWGNVSTQFPFESRDRWRNELQTNRRLGVNVYRGDELPTPGSRAEMAREFGRTYYHTRVLLNLPYMSSGWNGSLKPEDLKAEDEAKIADALVELVKKTQGLGLTYDDWFTELWDEPGITNAAVYGAIARILKKTDPNVKIYMNPLFWFWSPTEQETIAALKPYYNEVIDVSLPDIRLVGDNDMTRQLWAAPRYVRGSYVHPPAKAGRGRGMTWKSFKYGLNGWAYFSYYYPRGNPWDVSSWVELNYSYMMVFPGPNGPILTPVYEDMREGWEDYRMLTTLRQQGNESVLEELLADYTKGIPFPELRLKALRALQKK